MLITSLFYMEKEINKRKELQSHVISFIDDDNDAANFQALTKFICDNNISKTKIDLQDFLHLLINIADKYSTTCYQIFDLFCQIWRFGTNFGKIKLLFLILSKTIQLL